MLKKLIFKIKTHVFINNLINKIIPIYFFSVLDENLSYRNYELNEEFSINKNNQFISIVFKNVRYTFSFSEKNICFFQLELEKERERTWLLSKYSFLLKSDFINDEEMIFYTNSLLGYVDEILNDLDKQISDKPNYQKYKSMSLKNLKKEMVIKQFKKWQ